MPALPAATHMGPVHLTVADLDRSLAYYEGDIGLTPLSHDPGSAILGTPDRELLYLVEQPGAVPADGYTGLFHFALLVPERADLGQWLRHAAADGVQLTGASDHYVSEALYLRDPDHHGIEIYWDRPREIWEGQVDRMGSWPLDLDDIARTDGAEAPFEGLPNETVIGHVHLRVADVAATEAFYRDRVGMDVMAHLGDQATFLSAGGYHHHLGGNTWESRGAAPPPADTAALRHFTIVVPDQTAADELTARLDGELIDPSGNRFALTVAG